MDGLRPLSVELELVIGSSWRMNIITLWLYGGAQLDPKTI